MRCIRRHRGRSRVGRVVMWWGPKRLPDGQDKAPRGLRGRSALEATVLALAASGRPVRPEGEGARSGARGRGGAGKGRLCSCSALRACLGARHAVRLCWTEEDP